MIAIRYAPKFLKQVSKLERVLQKEVIEKVKLIQDPKNHKSLMVHKLHGRLAGSYAFSVNYRYRIVFDYVSRDEIVLLVIGDHNIYG